MQHALNEIKVCQQTTHTHTHTHTSGGHTPSWVLLQGGSLIDDTQCTRTRTAHCTVEQAYSNNNNNPTLRLLRPWFKTITSMLSLSARFISCPSATATDTQKHHTHTRTERQGGLTKETGSWQWWPGRQTWTPGRLLRAELKPSTTERVDQPTTRVTVDAFPVWEAASKQRARTRSSSMLR